MAVVARQRAESALRFLPQKTTWMEPFHIANFRAVLNEYVDFLERDDVLPHVLAGLRQHLSRTARDWNDLSIKKNAVEGFPQDALECFALRFDLLRTAVKYDKFDLRYFVTCLFPGAHMNEKLMHWKRLVVHPFAVDMRRLGELLLERLPKDEWVEIGDLVAPALEALAPQAFGSRGWTDADDEAAAKAEEAAKADAKRSALASDARSEARPEPRAAGEARASDDAGGVASKTRAQEARAQETRAQETRAQETRSPETRAQETRSPETRPALDTALDQLARAVGSAPRLGEDERHDLGIEVSIIALEAKRRGVRDRLRSRLECLAVYPGLEAAVSEVRRHLVGP